MNADEQAIRAVVESWMNRQQGGRSDERAQSHGRRCDLHGPGREPFGKEAFAAGNQTIDMRVEGTSDIQEIKVLGDWAWMRARFAV